MYTVFNFCGDKFLLESNADTGCFANDILINFLHAVIIWRTGGNDILLFPLQPEMMYDNRPVLQKYALFFKVTCLSNVNNMAAYNIFLSCCFMAINNAPSELKQG